MKPTDQDDLTRIRGLGVKAAQRLAEAGIRTFGELASLKPERIVARMGPDPGVTAEHVVKRDWIGQAARLAAAAAVKPEGPKRLRASSYIVELFLDLRDRVKGTKVHHVQSLDEEAWENWDGARLVEFFSRRPELRIASAEAREEAAPHTASAATQAPEPPEAPAPAGQEEALAAAPPKPAAPVSGDASPALVVRRLRIVAGSARAALVPLRAEQPLAVMVDFDLTGQENGSHEKVDYSASLVARRVGEKSSRIISASHGSLVPASTVTLDLPGIALPEGIYRTHATLTLSPGQGAPVIIQTTYEESLLQVL